jgi:mitotic spindle assembly checkpoint protein MAD1
VRHWITFISLLLADVSSIGQVSYLQKVEKENGRLTREVASLKQENGNIELLREEKSELESKVRSLDVLRKKYAVCEAACDALKQEKAEW